jgi:hypothetical protein
MKKHSRDEKNKLLVLEELKHYFKPIPKEFLPMDIQNIILKYIGNTSILNEILECKRHANILFNKVGGDKIFESDYNYDYEEDVREWINGYNGLIWLFNKNICLHEVDICDWYVWCEVCGWSNKWY